MMTNSPASQNGTNFLTRWFNTLWNLILLLVLPRAIGSSDNTDMNSGSCNAEIDSCSARVAAFKSGALKNGEDPKTISEEEWKKRLDPETYYIARQQGTEMAFSGKYYDHHEKGIYTCACCGAELFESSSKYESGSGWPSFYAAKGAKGTDDSATNVTRRTDESHGMRRVEVLCKQCAAHLGHVFPDGPRPTGLRYCINSGSLGFKPHEG